MNLFWYLNRNAGRSQQRRRATPRNYVDPCLNRLEDLLVASSLVWTATPLTTATFYSTTSIDETTLPGTSGVLTHTYTVEVDHDFRRWLAAIGKFTYGTLDNQGNNRGDILDRKTRSHFAKRYYRGRFVAPIRN